ncbi:MAG: DNA gyrase inhibitor YacG [Pasteurellaceae bacterium]|nr:DNA gyrase inhibitor YacG [Pasteurellaceae bacterium]
MSEIITVPCPHCQTAVVWSEQSPFRPFCSKRCQMIDLGEWVMEEKAIPGESAVLMIDDELKSEWEE